MAPRLPHPIPYQGSKRALAPRIGLHVPRGIDVWFEPFAGSAAMTLWAVHHQIARRYVIADALEPIAHLWQAIIDEPEATAARYRLIWFGQRESDRAYFDRVRARYNAASDPVDLLYLICRCVKNAVRFNAKGDFTQSVDRRRLGMHPDRMEAAITGAALMLRGRTEVRSGDWLSTTADAGAKDFVYLDPPYLGTTVGRDKRYARQLGQDRLIAGLESLLERRARFALSYDGMTGERTYGAPLPDALGLNRLLLDAGWSSQATLSGRAERTVESLYLSPDLAGPEGAIQATAASLR
ncbi:MAG: DNA adenine methylase [Hyphomicrobiaceae bacterium]